jgi:predicted nicotinamide N-methyase
LVTDRGVSLIDFDRARRLSPVKSAYRDWIGIGPRSLRSPYPFWKLALFALAPKVRSAGLRLRSALTSPKTQPVVSADHDLADLDQAWRTAERSKANAKGQSQAYYAFSYRGRHFPGERAWYSRWDPIRASVDFTGKSVLELGCNMGMLSTFATLSGAASAHGVDHDADIVDAARLVARALGSGATFEQLDLMGSEPWEQRLSGRDIVTALSVVHWLPEKDRVLQFLGTHDELIYEGHDTLDIETARLRSIGFSRIDVVLETERDRHILHARKP